MNRRTETLARISRIGTDSPYYEEIIRRHKNAINKNENTYVDPVTEYDVFTSAYLLSRGYCCGAGCRHCPYDEKGIARV